MSILLFLLTAISSCIAMTLVSFSMLEFMEYRNRRGFRYLVTATIFTASTWGFGYLLVAHA